MARAQLGLRFVNEESDEQKLTATNFTIKTRIDNSTVCVSNVNPHILYADHFVDTKEACEIPILVSSLHMSSQSFLPFGYSPTGCTSQSSTIPVSKYDSRNRSNLSIITKPEVERESETISTVD